MANQPWRVEITNGKMLRAALKKATGSLDELKEAHKDAAKIVALRAQATAPVGDPKNGHVKATVRPGASNRAGIVRAGNNRKIRYGGVVHYGTPASNTTVRGRRKPNPWIQKAARDTEGIWLKPYYDRLTEILESIK